MIPLSLARSFGLCSFGTERGFGSRRVLGFCGSTHTQGSRQGRARATYRPLLHHGRAADLVAARLGICVCTSSGGATTASKATVQPFAAHTAATKSSASTATALATTTLTATSAATRATEHAAVASISTTVAAHPRLLQCDALVDARAPAHDGCSHGSHGHSHSRASTTTASSAAGFDSVAAVAASDPASAHAAALDRPR
jgi:hypothetical protein